LRTHSRLSARHRTSMRVSARHALKGEAKHSAESLELAVDKEVYAVTKASDVVIGADH
jgi:molybdopterin-binding protein